MLKLRLQNINQKKLYTILIIWTIFNLFALLMSYTEIKIFNAEGEAKKEKFWPFVNFTEYYYENKYGVWDSKDEYPEYADRRSEVERRWKGLFVQYDWTEAAFYIGIAWTCCFLYEIRKKL